MENNDSIRAKGLVSNGEAESTEPPLADAGPQSTFYLAAARTGGEWSPAPYVRCMAGLLERERSGVSPLETSSHGKNTFEEETYGRFVSSN